MRQIFLSCILVQLFALGCSDNKQTEKLGVGVIYHYNVMIVPDLSNRIMEGKYPKPVSDQRIIEGVLDLIYPDILTVGRQENQQDLFRISFINEGVINLYELNMGNLEIDFSDFDNQLERIDYIVGNAIPNLGTDLDLYKNEISKAYAQAQQETYGADIWSFFNKMDSYSVKDTIRSFTYEGDKYVERFKNVMILITDGYLEAGIYDEKGCESDNLCYFLSGRTINEFRSTFKNSGMRDMSEFFKQAGYGIVPVNNDALNNLDIILLEAYDRSLDKSGNATIFPSDYQIMELFWKDWMEKSSVKSFQMHQTVADQNEASQKIKSFIGIK
jgi:hypothetical protein